MLSFLKLHFPSWVKKKQKQAAIRTAGSPLELSEPPNPALRPHPSPRRAPPSASPSAAPCPRAAAAAAAPLGPGLGCSPPGSRFPWWPGGGALCPAFPAAGARRGRGAARSGARRGGGGAMPEAVPRSCCAPGAAPAPGWGQRRGLPAALGGFLAAGHLL